jgi:putative DNA primase/helicase
MADGRWHRVPTEDKPRKRNGAYLYTGDRGVLKNWATMDGFETWKAEQQQQNVGRQVIKDIQRSFRDERLRHEKARQEATAIIRDCDRMTHVYLASKGFPETTGLVHTSGDLIIPMRDVHDYGVVNTVQRIRMDGSKLFLTGGKAKGSVFVFARGARGVRYLVEGYATGLSVQTALIDMRKRCEVWVCFSSGNLTYVAQFVKRPAIVVADNDESGAGQKAAEATGLPWVMAPEYGDANDWHQKHGLRALVKVLLAPL